jgi:hypothetical protein
MRSSAEGLLHGAEIYGVSRSCALHCAEHAPVYLFVGKVSSIAALCNSNPAGVRHARLLTERKMLTKKRRSRTWSFPEGGVVVVELFESTQIRVTVVDELLKGAISHATHRLPVSAGEMAHRSPSIHLISVASGDGRRTCKQRSKSEVLHGGENDFVRRKKWTASRTTARHALFISLNGGSEHACCCPALAAQEQTVEPVIEAPAILAIAAQCLTGTLPEQAVAPSYWMAR